MQRLPVLCLVAVGVLLASHRLSTDAGLRQPTQTPSTIHTCRHPDNGVETTHTVALFVACRKPGQDCNQMAHAVVVPANVHIIKGFLNPFMRPWDSNGTPNRCDPNGNADSPCWAAAELVVYKRAPNPKCLCDSD